MIAGTHILNLAPQSCSCPKAWISSHLFPPCFILWDRQLQQRDKEIKGVAQRNERSCPSLPSLTWRALPFALPSTRGTRASEPPGRDFIALLQRGLAKAAVQLPDCAAPKSEVPSPSGAWSRTGRHRFGDGSPLKSRQIGGPEAHTAKSSKT